MGIISAGYGDGYTRHFSSGTPVLLNGRRVPLIGNVSMDMIAVDLGDNPEDRLATLRPYGVTACRWRRSPLRECDSVRTGVRRHAP